MAQKTEMQAKDHHTQTDHIGDDEVSELQRPNSIYVKVREQAKRFACTRMGQMVIERMDRGLKLLEDTTKWSLPHDKNSDFVLERPLPWFPFLLLIIVLRLVRTWLSIAAFLIGNGPISPLDMIYFIQTRRRKLRAIRIHGLRVMRENQLTATSTSNGSTFTQKMSQWLNRAICRPGVRQAKNCSVINVSTTLQQNNQMNKSVTSKRSCDDSNVDQNLTIDEMLAKYANDNSDDDSDFVPPEENGSHATSSSSSDLSDSDSDGSNEISSAEEQLMAETLKTITPQMKVNQEKLNSANGSNGISEPNLELVRPEPEPNKLLEVKEKEEEQWKSSPGHLSAAMTKTPIYNNAAAAVNNEPISNPTPHNSQTVNDPVRLTENESDNDNDNDKDNINDKNDNDSDCDTDDTVCQQQLTGEHNATAAMTTDLSYPNPDHPTVETLTPATSSEDIFYSPIGSPNNFNSCIGTQALLKNAAIIAAPNHYTSNSEQDEIYSAGSEIEDQSRPSISLAYQAEQQDSHSSGKPFKQQQQQQQRQFNHSHQRFRGRNRR